LHQDISRELCPPELHGVLELLKSIRRKIVTNLVLEGWTEWTICILIGLIAAEAVSARLGVALMLGAAILIVGAAVILVWIWRTRPSTYETACRLDGAARLQDRVSTAIYFSDTGDSDPMLKQQRTDAVTKLAKIDPSGMFPLRAPATASLAFLLVVIFGGLFVYRINHKAPLVALLRTTARSSLVQSIFSPIVHAMEKDLERTIALVTLKPDPQADEVRPGEAMPTSDDLWQPADDKKPDSKEATPQDMMSAQDEDQEGKPQGQGDPNAMPPSDQQQQGNPGQPQQGNQKQSDSQGSQQSMTQKMMDALKNMMSDPKNQQNNKNGQQQNQQNAPQQGGNPPPGAQESDKKGDSKGNSDQKQNASKSAGSGAGNQKGLNEMVKDQAARPVNATPDRVGLEATGFKEDTRMRVDTETGTAHMAAKDGTSQADAVINGAEQENIPARYRLYVQRYFEHTDNGSKSTSEPR
jgi:hypothetical protein